MQMRKHSHIKYYKYYIARIKYYIASIANFNKLSSVHNRKHRQSTKKHKRDCKVTKTNVTLRSLMLLYNRKHRYSTKKHQRLQSYLQVQLRYTCTSLHMHTHASFRSLAFSRVCALYISSLSPSLLSLSHAERKGHRRVIYGCAESGCTCVSTTIAV